MPKFQGRIWVCLVAFAEACSSPQPNSSQGKAIQATRPGGIEANASGISGLAEREVIRRQERVRRADSAALEANRASAGGDQEAAIRSYRKALDTLPSGN